MNVRTTNPRRALSGHLNDPNSGVIESEQLRVVWTLSALSRSRPAGFASRRRGDVLNNAIAAAEAHVPLNAVLATANQR